jgi:hypothetical protein
MIYLLLSPLFALWYLQLSLCTTGLTAAASARGLRPFFGTSWIARAARYACAGVLGLTAGACELRCATQMGPQLGTPTAPIARLVGITGILEIALLIGVLLVPALARCHADTQALPSGTRRTLWTFAAALWAMMLGAAVLAAFVPEILTPGEPGTRVANAFIACQWAACVGIVLHATADTLPPRSRRNRVGHGALVALLLGVTAIHAWLAWAP